MKSKNYRSLLLASSSVLCGLTHLAQAQNATNDDGLEVVIVTAERRETSLQETQVAIEVLSGDSIEKAETRSIEGITTMFAGLQYNAGNRDQARLSLRGNTTNDDSAGTPIVSGARLGTRRPARIAPHVRCVVQLGF